MFRPPQYPSRILYCSLYHTVLPLLALFNDLMSSSGYPRCTDVRVTTKSMMSCAETELTPWPRGPSLCVQSMIWKPEKGRPGIALPSNAYRWSRHIR